MTFEAISTILLDSTCICVNIPYLFIFLTYFSLCDTVHLQRDGDPDLWAQREKENVKVKVAQLYPTLCNPVDYTVRGILQARILEWVAFVFFQPRDRREVSCIAGGFFNN